MSTRSGKRQYVLGVGFDPVSMDEAVARAVEMAGGAETRYVVTPNAEIVQAAAKDNNLKEILNAADLVLPDGISIIKAADILGLPIKERVPGTDFAEALLPELARAGFPLFLLGGKPGVADEASNRLKERYPGLIIAGANDGYFGDNAAVCKKIKDSGAKVVYVCIGAPKQEKWMAEHGDATGASLLAGLGGTVDIFAGTVKRAPKVFQKLGLEWFYRLVREPWRFGRMIKLPLFLVDVRRSKKAAQAGIQVGGK